MFTAKVSEILKECQQIKHGATRAELLKIFTTEGGLSTAKHRIYVHRHCPYIKVAVEFNLTDPKQSVIEELSTDCFGSVRLNSTATLM